MLHISQEMLSNFLSFFLPLVIMLTIDFIIYVHIFLIFKIQYAKLYVLFTALIIFTCTVE